MSKKAVRGWALGIGGVVYLEVVFFQNIYSPFIAGLLVVLAAYELVDSHRARSQPSPRRRHPPAAPATRRG
ncbi:MAG: hypothetical protein LAP40_16235 [Acidobacteriia bacterium]|nr:hypothetical protein [Terriglobia bacterium]